MTPKKTNQTNATKQGMLITVEGIEGMGKSTAVEFIQQYLNEHSIDFITTREPGGTPTAELIRERLLSINLADTLTEISELLLVFAGRSQHVEHLIKPALKHGTWVLSDRFVDASYAYQGGGRGIDLAKIKWLDDLVLGGLEPNLTILLDAPVEVGMARIASRGEKDRIESEAKSFFERAKAVYLDRAKHYKNRYQIIDASQSVANVKEQLERVLNHFISQHHHE